MGELVPTSSQTVGPFFDIGLAHLAGRSVISVNGEGVNISGRVLDGDGDGVPDALLEIWHQATDDQSEAVAFVRVLTDDTGAFSFDTVIPSGPRMPAYLTVLVFMRGLLKPLLTRLYVPDHSLHDPDGVLAMVADDRRSTLIARCSVDPRRVEWNIVLQGRDETVFFEW